MTRYFMATLLALSDRAHAALMVLPEPNRQLRQPAHLGAHRRRALTRIAVMAAVPVLVIGIPAASASAAGEAPSSACQVHADDLVADSVQEQTGDASDADGASFDFTCLGDDVSATLTSDAGDVDAGTTFTSDDPTSTDGPTPSAEPTNAVASLAARALNLTHRIAAFVGPGGSEKRTIVDQYTDQVLDTLYYGQQNSPSNGTWTNDIDLKFTLNLQQSVHLYVVKWNQLQYRSVGFSGDVSLERMHGIFSPAEVDFDSWNSKSRSSDTIRSNLYRDGLTDGVYAVRVWHMHVSDGARSFSHDVSGDFHSHRFSCPKNKQCLYPGSKEAPVLG